MPTIEQIRAARALLDWSQSDLANYAGLSQTGIARIENGTNQPNSSTIEKIKGAFENAEIEFLGETGLRRKTGEIKVLRGGDGFSAFLDDVYDCIIKYGTKEKPLEVFLSNVVHENWIKTIGTDRWMAHTKRMVEKKDLMDIRIIVADGDWNFPANEYSDYKWFPKEFFSDKSFYSYHNRLAFLDFEENNMRATIINNKEFAEGYRTLFQIAWNHVAQTPQKKSTGT